MRILRVFQVFWILPLLPLLPLPPVLQVLSAVLVDGLSCISCGPPPKGGGFYVQPVYPWADVRFSGTRAYTVTEVIKVTSCEWVAAVNALALAIANDRPPEEVAFLALLFTQLGDTLAVLAASPPKCF